MITRFTRGFLVSSSSAGPLWPALIKKKPPAKAQQSLVFLNGSDPVWEKSHARLLQENPVHPTWPEAGLVARGTPQLPASLHTPELVVVQTA